MFSNKYSHQATQLEAFLGQRAEALSRETGFVQRRSKLTGAKFVQAVVLGWLEAPQGSLPSIVQACREVGVTISEAGLQQRLNERAVTLLQRLFEEGVKHLPRSRRLPEKVLHGFSGVYLLDSTTITLPACLAGEFAGCGGNGTTVGVKLQLSLDYLNGSIEALAVVAGREADQKCDQHLALAHAGSLHLFDLGFFKQQVFAELAQRQAFFISRLLTQTAIYALNGTPLDLPKLLSAHPGNTLDLEVQLGRLTHLRVRLVAQRLPPDQVAQRRRDARRRAQRHGLTCTARHLELLAWSVFITNIPPDRLNAAQVGLVYRVRWQVELLFKLWKSQARLAEVGHCGRHRFLCQLYARLLGLLLFQWVLVDVPPTPDRELSLPKAFTLFQRSASLLRAALSQPRVSLSVYWSRLVDDLRRFPFKQKRRQQPSTLAQLLASAA